MYNIIECNLQNVTAEKMSLELTFLLSIMC